MQPFHWIYFGILSATALIGLVRLSKLSTSSKVMLLLVVITTLSEGIARYLLSIKASNLPVYHVFGPIEASLIIWAFAKEFRQKSLLYLIGIVWLFSIANSLFFESFYTFNSHFFVAEVVLVVCLSVFYFYKLLNQNILYRFAEYPMFWVSTGLLIFFLTNLVMLGTFNVLGVKNQEVFDFFLQIRKLSNYMLYILIGVGFLSKQRTLYISN